MKKKIVVIASMFLVFATPARADTIGGIEFDIPEEWEIVDEMTEGSFEQTVYSFGNEAIVISVMPVSEDDPVTAYNEAIYDCENVFGENEGFYLMTNIEATSSDTGCLSRAQECVYMDSDKWCYGNLIGQNNGSHAITLIYSAPTNIEHSQITPFGNIVSQIISGVE